MIKMRFFCDLCGKETNDGLSKYTIPGYKKDFLFSGADIKVKEIETDVEVDVCDECREKIRETFDFHW